MKKKEIESDLIIVTRNGLKFTKECIKSVLKNTSDVKYRFIFIDNNSSDKTVEYLKTIKNSILISNSENVGFIKAMNQGFERVEGKYVVWLNNDTIVSQHWLRYLIDHLENHPKSGAIGPLSNGTGIIQKTNDFDKDPTLENVNKFGHKLHSKNTGQVVEYHRIAGFCIVMKSELISKVGKLDERFGIGGHDDDDYCKRIRNSGYKILIAKDVFIYHKSGSSFSLSGDPDLELSFLIQKNRQKFLEKWSGTKPKFTFTENKPLVSIIMCTKDRDYIIHRAINSVISQTYKNWELLVINDGGKDIKEIIEKFSDSRINYINLEKNWGKSHANNVGIKKSKGEIIAYLDDDDCWYENHIELTVGSLLKNSSRSVVYTDYIRVRCIMTESGVINPVKKEVVHIQEAKYDTFNEMNFIPNFCLVHRKSIFQSIQAYDEILEYYEDWDFIRRLSKRFLFFHVPQITGEYWIEQFGSTRNTKALIDPKLKDSIKYIKNKEQLSPEPDLQSLYLADNLVQKDNLKAALNKYEKIIQTDSEFIPALEGMAARKFSMKKFEDSLLLWNKVLQLNPNNLFYYQRAAQSCIYTKNFQKAKELLEYALIISDEKINYYLLYQCYKNLNSKKTADFILDQSKLAVENISFDEIETFLLKLYNKSYFYRKLLVLGYKILKKLSKI